MTEGTKELKGGETGYDLTKSVSGNQIGEKVKGQRGKGGIRDQT